MIILKVLLLIILYLLLFLIGALIILLISPIKGSVRFDVKSYKFKGSYLFGIAKIYVYDGHYHIRLFGIRIYKGVLKKESTKVIEDEEDSVSDKSTEDDTTKVKDHKTKKKKYGIPSKKIIYLTAKLVKKLIKIIASKHLYLKATLGIDDPYYIGLINLITHIIISPLNRIKNYELIFIPIYDDIAIDYEGYADIHFSVIQLILPVLRFILRKPIRNYLQLFKRKKMPKN